MSPNFGLENGAFIGKVGLLRKRRELGREYRGSVNFLWGRLTVPLEKQEICFPFRCVRMRIMTLQSLKRAF